MLTEPGDLVIDPFAGSNVTGQVAESSGRRRYLTVEIDRGYLEGSSVRFEKVNAEQTRTSPADPERPPSAMPDPRAATMADAANAIPLRYVARAGLLPELPARPTTPSTRRCARSSSTALTPGPQRWSSTFPPSRSTALTISDDGAGMSLDRAPALVHELGRVAEVRVQRQVRPHRHRLARPDALRAASEIETKRAGSQVDYQGRHHPPLGARSSPASARARRLAAPVMPGRACGKVADHAPSSGFKG